MSAKEMKYTVLPERLPMIPKDKMTEEQRKVAADLESSRGSLKGPFVATIRCPKFADRQQHLGAYIRYECGLDMRINRLASMMVARQWTSQYEWHGAVPYALTAGISQGTIDALAEGRHPPNMPEDEEIAYSFVTELHNNKSVSDATYERALKMFGETGIVDLVGVVAYYTMNAMVMNVSRTPVPGGGELPLAPLPHTIQPG